MDSSDDLFRRYRAKPDRDGLARLIEAHQDAVYNLCYQVLRNTADAEDASQEALVKIPGAIRTVSDPIHFRHWLRRICLTTCIDLQRARSRRQEREATMERPGTAPSPELSAALADQLARLDDGMRGLIVEHYFERRTLEDLARGEGVSVAAVWKRLQKGTGELRRAFEAAGMTGAALGLLPFLEGLAPVKAPSGLAAAVLARAEVLTPAISGGMIMAATTKILVPVAAGILLGGLASAGWTAAAPRRPASIAAHDDAFASRLEAARRRVASLEEEQARLLAGRDRDTTATPAPSGPPKDLPRGFDWKGFYALMDWKRFAELSVVEHPTADDRKALAGFEEEGFRAMMDGFDRYAAPGFNDHHLARALCMLRGLSETRPDLRPLVDEAQADIDRLVLAPDPIRLANALPLFSIRERLRNLLQARGERSASWIDLDCGLPMAMLDASNAGQAVTKVARYWQSHLQLDESALQTLEVLARRYVDAWLAMPTNRGFFDGAENAGRLPGADRGLIEATVTLQRDLLRMFELGDEAASWLRDSYLIFWFQSPS